MAGRLEKNARTLEDAGQRLKGLWQQAERWPAGAEPYRQVGARLALIGHLTGGMPLLSCAGGRLFTREPDAEIEFLATVADHRNGRLLPPGRDETVWGEPAMTSGCISPGFRTRCDSCSPFSLRCVRGCRHQRRTTVPEATRNTMPLRPPLVSLKSRSTPMTASPPSSSALAASSSRQVCHACRSAFWWVPLWPPWSCATDRLASYRAAALAEWCHLDNRPLFIVVPHVTPVYGI